MEFAEMLADNVLNIDFTRDRMASKVILLI